MMPFANKLVGLIRASKPSSENPLYRSLAVSIKNVKKLSEVAMDCFPAALIDKIPAEILKTLLIQYPMGKKVELVLSLPEDRRDFFVDLFAPVGSKALDVLELELEKSRGDIKIMREINDAPERAWNDFVFYVRNFVKNDRNNQGTFENLVTTWAQSLS